MTEAERSALDDEKQCHREIASKRYRLKSQDKEMCKNSVNAIVVMVDLQKCLPTPLITNSQSLYLKNFVLINYTIYDPVSKNSYCMMYNESGGARGGNEMASCFLKWAMKGIVGNDNVESLIVWSDNCSGQNRNNFMVLQYFLAIVN